MAKKEKALKDKVVKLWLRTKRDLENVVNDAGKLIRKGEEQIKEISEKSREKLELMSLKLKRENLYYRLGKTLAGLSRSRWQENKKLQKLISEVKKLEREIRKRSQKK